MMGLLLAASLATATPAYDVEWMTDYAGAIADFQKRNPEDYDCVYTGRFDKRGYYDMAQIRCKVGKPHRVTYVTDLMPTDVSMKTYLKVSNYASCQKTGKMLKNNYVVRCRVR